MAYLNWLLPPCEHKLVIFLSPNLLTDLFHLVDDVSLKLLHLDLGLLEIKILQIMVELCHFFRGNKPLSADKAIPYLYF